MHIRDEAPIADIRLKAIKEWNNKGHIIYHTTVGYRSQWENQ